MTGPLRKCPQCGSRYRRVVGSPWRPFCSERCQLLDLGDWLSERHAIAGDPAEPDPDLLPPDDTP